MLFAGNPPALAESRVEPWSDAPPEMLPAWRLVPPPITARRTARLLALLLLAFAVLCAASPWQQSVRGDGSVVAFDAADRPMTIEAPTKGVVRRWHVQEGETVVGGQLLVSLEDNDPRRLERLRAERDAAAETADRKADGVRALEASLIAAQIAADAKVAATGSKVDAANRKIEAASQKVAAAAAKLETASRNLERVQALHAEGLTSQRKLELAVLKAAEGQADLLGAEAEQARALADREAAASDRDEARADADSKLSSLESKLESARGEVAAAQAKRIAMETKLSRQETQEVAAPRDGVVQRLLVAQGSEQVKEGDPLALIVPPRRSATVALTVDGNDAALLEPGRSVRLQFEGWPAVQFVGWPSVAAGTFGGLVQLIDPASDGSGNFRVIVSADPDDAPWPPTERLRPGVRTHGWVLLEQVPLGFELWRQLNGFPPTVPEPKGAKGAKAPKVGK